MQEVPTAFLCFHAAGEPFFVRAATAGDGEQRFPFVAVEMIEQSQQMHFRATAAELRDEAQNPSRTAPRGLCCGAS